MHHKRAADLNQKNQLSEKFLPNPQNAHCTNHAEDEIGQIAKSEKVNAKHITNEGTCITANYANYEIHAATFPFTLHNSIGNVTDKDACQYRPRSKICNMFKHNTLLIIIINKLFNPNRPLDRN